MREMTIGPRAPSGGGLLKGQELATTFSFLRPNDLVWNYVVGNYLKGETPPPFDLLYWNSDSTNLPGPMYCWYLRNTYLENKLDRAGQADGLRREGRPRRDRRAGLHLRLARGPHRAVGRRLPQHRSVLKGKRRFVLGASGHIAGVINPPAKKQAQPLDRQTTAAADAARSLVRHGRPSIPAAGGPTGRRGCKAHGGKQVAAPKTPGNRKLQADRAGARPLRQGEGLIPAPLTSLTHGEPS